MICCKEAQMWSRRGGGGGRRSLIHGTVRNRAQSKSSSSGPL